MSKELIITVVSGKGGTGKTAIATSLSATIQNSHLMDCDVENPNSYIYMKPDIKHINRVTVDIPKIDYDKCDDCKICADSCKFGALVPSGDKLMFFEVLCHSCAACWTVCPNGAIVPTKREFGTITEGDTSWKTIFTEGNMDVGEMLTPSMINKVKEKIQPEHVTIIDGPPGAGCPLDSTVEDSDFVILVTEPTIFGLHDLKRAMTLVKQKEIPLGVIINRSDIGTVDIEGYCNSEDVPILMSIPFKREIAERYSNGEMFIDIDPSLNSEFLDVYSWILEELK